LQLIEILERLAPLVTGQKLIIVGSQSVHLQVKTPPQVMLSSIEVDVLLRERFDLHDVIEEQFGAESAYHAEHGIYADPLGAGIVTLPPGWEDRLVPIKNDAGSVAWWALEIHDACATKLIAGREKDFEFITALCFADSFSFDTFLERVALMQQSPHRGALRPRLQKLVEQLPTRQVHEQQVKAEKAMLSLG
jgi:hypothetical protein